MKYILPILLLTIAFTSTVSGDYTDVRDYQWWVLQSNTANGAVATTSITVPATPYSPTRAGLQSVWEISATYGSNEPLTGVSTIAYQLVIDGTNVAGCTWTVTRAAVEFVPALGLLTVLRQSDNFLVRCLDTGNTIDPGAHTLAITATGTNPVVESRVDVMLLMTDSLTVPAVTVTNLNSLQTNVNSNTNATGLINRMNINGNTNSTVNRIADEMENGTWARWDYSSNRVHLKQINDPIPTLDISGVSFTDRIFDKYGYGYLFLGDDTDITNDAQDYGLYSDRRQSLNHFGDLSLFTSFTPLKRTPTESGLVGPMIADYNSNAPNSYWKVRIQNGGAISACDFDEDTWRIAYSHDVTNIFGNECFPYDEQYTLILTRNVTANTVSWSVNGDTDGPFSYTTDPQTGFDGMIVIGSCGPSLGTTQDCVDATSASTGGSINSKDYAGVVQELRVWDHLVDSANLTLLADPFDNAYKFCTEGTESVLYHLEPYLVQPLQNCLELSSTFISIGDSLTQVFNGTNYLNQTINGNVTQSFFNTTVENMPSELLETTEIVLPILILILLILWAETKQDWWVALMACLCAFYVTINLWSEVDNLRFLFIAACVFMAIRAAMWAPDDIKSRFKRD